MFISKVKPNRMIAQYGGVYDNTLFLYKNNVSIEDDSHTENIIGTGEPNMERLIIKDRWDYVIANLKHKTYGISGHFYDKNKVAIVLATIPEGTPYYINDEGLIVSKSLVVDAVLTNGDEISNWVDNPVRGVKLYRKNSEIPYSRVSDKDFLYRLCV